MFFIWKSIPFRREHWVFPLERIYFSAGNIVFFRENLGLPSRRQLDGSANLFSAVDSFFPEEGSPPWVVFLSFKLPLFCSSPLAHRINLLTPGVVFYLLRNNNNIVWNCEGKYDTVLYIQLPMYEIVLESYPFKLYLDINFVNPHPSLSPYPIISDVLNDPVNFMNFKIVSTKQKIDISYFEVYCATTPKKVSYHVILSDILYFNQRWEVQRTQTQVTQQFSSLKLPRVTTAALKTSTEMSRIMLFDGN